MWIIATIAAVATAFLIRNKRYRWIYILMKTYKRDLRIITGFAKLNVTLWLWKRQGNTIPKQFASIVERIPNKIAFYFEDSSLTYLQVDEYSNQVARFFTNQGFKKGDIIALVLENRHEYPCIWLGLSKIGVIAALINTNLVNAPLLHSIKVANCKAVIFGSNHSEAINNILDKLELTKLYQFHEITQNCKDLLQDCVDLRKGLSDASTEKLDEKIAIQSSDPLVYIYTSGTTGLPKAAVITNLRFLFMSTAFNYLAKLKADDIIYNPLPLYHTAGGMIGVGQTLIHGQAMAIRKKFSASNYWSDCAKYKCTIAQYVGEICRYILAAPRKEPLNHCVRAIFGNGLKPQIWNEYVNTFNIKEVFEFYGATEGISNIMNVDSTPGSIGFVPRYAGAFYPVTLIKCNELTGEAIRNKAGLCTQCDINEPGLVIAKINQKNPLQAFKGYSDRKATEKKILQNVFRFGDMYFNSGDILVQDELGNFYFKDRTGDTFRWKGENVSTSEVEGIISNIVDLNDAVVYGVEIPNTEGRAGMAAIVDSNNSLDMERLGKGLRENLPGYAVPVFIRVMKEVPLTGTYKLKKIELQSEGYDVEKIKDSVYFYNPKLKQYVDLSKDLYSQIMKGGVSV